MSNKSRNIQNNFDSRDSTERAGVARENMQEIYFQFYILEISIWLFCDESENSWYANHGSVSGLGHKLSEGSMHSRQTYEFKSSWQHNDREA